MIIRTNYLNVKNIPLYEHHFSSYLTGKTGADDILIVLLYSGSYKKSQLERNVCDLVIVFLSKMLNHRHPSCIVNCGSI